MSARYRGRFAPSPTGPLHFGSLIAATGSYLDARAQGGEWLVRMEDLDTPRVVPGASESILRTLEQFGFAWDGPVLYQSRRQEAYEATLAELREEGWVFPCGCSRREVSEDGRYPGTCRAGLPEGRVARAWRLRVSQEPIRFVDRLQGPQEQQLEESVGDFVLRRADGLFAYQLAVVVDDAAQGITDIVRGADLLDSTPRQIYLQRLLGIPTPRYLHLPVALNDAGQKWSKQTLAPAVEGDASGVLRRVLEFLGQSPPAELSRWSIGEAWAWSVSHWRPDRIPAVYGIPAFS